MDHQVLCSVKGMFDHLRREGGGGGEALRAAVTPHNRPILPIHRLCLNSYGEPTGDPPVAAKTSFME